MLTRNFQRDYGVIRGKNGVIDNSVTQIYCGFEIRIKHCARDFDLPEQ